MSRSSEKSAKFLRMGLLGFVSATLLMGAAMTSVAGASSAAPSATSAKKVNGTWKMTTTDCVYGCSATIALVQSGAILTDPSNPNVYGTISGRVIDVSLTLSPGHLWQCTGNLNKKFTKIKKGLFTAISVTTTTTGTCKMVKS